MEAGGAKDRATFIEVGEILKRTLDCLRDVRRHLEELPVRRARTRLFVDALVRKRQALENAINESLRGESAELMDVFVQYGVDPWMVVETPLHADSPEDLARWQSKVDGALSASLSDVAGRIENPQAKEVVEVVVRMLDAHDRRVSREVQELRDL